MGRYPRRIIGIAALMLFMLVYVVVATEIGAAWFAEAGVLAQVAYFAIAGVAWTLPAAGIITWMRRAPSHDKAD